MRTRGSVWTVALVAGFAVGARASAAGAADLQVVSNEYGTIEATMAGVERDHLRSGDLLHVRVMQDNAPLRCSDFELFAPGSPAVFQIVACDAANNLVEVRYLGGANLARRRAAGVVGDVFLEARAVSPEERPPEPHEVPPLAVTTAPTPALSHEEEASRRQSGGTLAQVGGAIVLLGFCTGGAVLWGLETDSGYSSTHSTGDAAVVATLVGGGIMTLGGVLSIAGAVMYSSGSRGVYSARSHRVLAVDVVPTRDGAIGTVGFTF